MINAEIYNFWYLSHKKVDIILFWSMLFFAFLKRKEIFFICVRKVQQLLPVTLKLYSDFSVELERRKLLVQKYENYLKCKWFEISFFFYILKQGYMKLINKIYACFVHILANMCLTYRMKLFSYMPFWIESHMLLFLYQENGVPLLCSCNFNWL